MTTVSVGDKLKDKRTLAGVGPGLTKGSGLLDGEDIHTVDLKTGDVLTTLVVLGDGRRTVSSGTHTVLVV